jgi:hypothetical protein
MNKKQLIFAWIMVSRNLKKVIGVIYLLLVVSIFLINLGIYNRALHRLIVCFNFAYLGLGIRGLVYFGILKNG